MGLLWATDYIIIHMYNKGATVSDVKFKRLSADQRQMALVIATLDLIALHGLHGATVRAIADRAGVTQGLIRHYFSSKEDLFAAAFEYHMTDMTDRSLSKGHAHTCDALGQFVEFVAAALSPPVVSARSLTIWVAFMQQVHSDVALRTTHHKTYLAFRNALQVRVQAALAAIGQFPDAAELQSMATACNAVIDGLWLEGGALPDDFERSEILNTGLFAIGRITGLDLRITEQGNGNNHENI